jgi:hypothetical protein
LEFGFAGELDEAKVDDFECLGAVEDFECLGTWFRFQSHAPTGTLSHHVDQPSRSGNDDMRILGQAGLLRPRRGSAIDAAGCDALDLGKLLALDLYLASELAGRGHYEGQGSLGCALEVYGSGSGIYSERVWD